MIIFDLDGTLVDSRRDIADAANALLVEHGASPLEEEQVGRMVGDGAAALVARAFEAAGRVQPSDALELFIQLYEERLVAHTRPYPGIPDVLTALGARATLAVLTNKPTVATRTILDALELSQFFDRDLVIGGDGPFGRKPAPSGVLHLVDAAHAELSETVLVGDSFVDWRTAAAAGTRIVLAKYGFGFETFPGAALRPSDLVVDAPLDLLRIL